jgi:hypothetical protein
MSDLPEGGSKPNRSRSLEDLAGAEEEDRDETPVQLNVRVPKWLRTELKRRTVGTEETMESIVQEALARYLDS